MGSQRDMSFWNEHAMRLGHLDLVDQKMDLQVMSRKIFAGSGSGYTLESASSGRGLSEYFDFLTQCCSLTGFQLYPDPTCFNFFTVYVFALVSSSSMLSIVASIIDIFIPCANFQVRSGAPYPIFTSCGYCIQSKLTRLVSSITRDMGPW